VKRSIRVALASATAASTLTLAACGGSAGEDNAPQSTGGDGSLETTGLSVGVQPFAEVSAFYLALEEGLFEEEGLTVTPQVATGGGAGLITGIVAGDMQIAYSNYVSVVQAASEGLRLRVVRENDRPGVQGLYSLPDSGISEPADLAGKRIAINGLGNIMELTARDALDEAGVDPDRVSFVELAPPDFLSALASGDVDAAWLVEPFVSIGTNTQGVQLVLDVFSGPTEELPVAGWITSPQFAQENPETLAAFTRAMDAAIQMVADDPSLVAEVVPTYTQLTADVAAGLNPINFAVENRLEDIGQVEELMRKHGFIDEEVPTDELILQSGG
jgi:NitT/TauT family transport system substrate-binding protein